MLKFQNTISSKGGKEKGDISFPKGFIKPLKFKPISKN